MTIDVSEVARRVKRQFGDESGAQITDTDILDWVLDAAREISLQIDNLLQKTDYFDSVADQQSYDLPSDCIAVQSVGFNPSSDTTSSYYELRYLSPKAMNEYLNGWDGSAHLNGTPLYYSRGDFNKFIVFPKPDQNITDAFKIIYSRYSATITTLSENLELPDYFFNTVVEYCLMKAYELDEDWEGAARKAQYVQSTINANGTRGYMNNEVYPSVVPISEDYV